MIVSEYKNKYVPRPAQPKPEPGAPAIPTLGEDGFTYYTCAGECGQTKIAALFLPDEIVKPEPVCRVCLGEVSIRTRKARNPKFATAAHYKADLARRSGATR